VRWCDEAMTTTARQPRRAGSSWFTFAAIMFTLAGASNLLWGIGALDNKQYLPENGLIASSLEFWGWLSIVWALMAVTGAVLLFMRNPYSAGVALCLAALNALFWLFAIPVLPIWSLVVISIDVLIIYQLSAHLDVLDG
jgi:hypothetical protein